VRVLKPGPFAIHVVWPVVIAVARDAVDRVRLHFENSVLGHHIGASEIMRDSTTKGDFFNGKKFVGEVVHALGVRALVLLGLAKISFIIDHLRIPLVGSNWDWSSRFSLYFASQRPDGIIILLAIVADEVAPGLGLAPFLIVFCLAIGFHVRV